jgi:2-oxoglutarate dehydrogenase E1 component
MQDIAICRVEQLSPFPYKEVNDLIKKYSNAKLAWAQEEHWNMGGWSYVNQRINSLVPNDRMVTYIGRPPSGAPATGFVKTHNAELAKLLSDAMAHSQ